MVDSSDSFDDDDAFYNNVDLAVLDQVEAQAISSTQANRPVKLQKDPRPINTEPRAGGKSTFGFGELGKHTHPANETRYIDGVEKRKEYWNLKRDDDDYPSVTIDATGRYGLAQESDDDEVVDLHAPGGRALAYGHKRALQPDPPASQGAQARREALGVAGPSRMPPPPLPADTSRLPGSQTRTLSRSVSAGKQVIVPRTARHQSNLAPIASQSSQPPSSQGSQVRRSALQLEDEKRKREELEEQVRTLQAQLRAKKAPHWTDGVAVELNGEPLEKQIKALQAQLWQAKGEAETVRRTHKTDAGKHLDETDRLKTRIAALERAIVEKEKENAARVESVKSQAIFATHAAFNSTTTSRTRSARVNENGGSPSRRQAHPESGALKRGEPSVKEPPTRFGGLTNGFALSPKIRRPVPHSPVPEQPLGSPVSQALPEERTITEENPLLENAQLAHHVLNFAGTARKGDDHSTDPLSYRLLRLDLPPSAEGYHDCCARLLRACSETDPSKTFGEIVDSLVGILGTVTRAAIASQGPGTKIPEALSHTLSLLASTLFRFPTCFPTTDLIDHLKSLCLHFYSSGPGLRSPPEKLSATDKILLGDQLIQVCEALCWTPELKPWEGDKLVVIIYLLSDPKHNHLIVMRALDLFHAASCHTDNFRALVGASELVRADDHRKSRLDLPIIERFSRYLMAHHPGCTVAETRRMNMTIVQSIGMTSLANPDAAVLLSERSSLVPGLIVLLNREATGLLGMSEDPVSTKDILSTISFALSILHHLVYPSPLLLKPRASKTTLSQARQDPFVSHDHLDPESSAEPPQGIDLQARLLTASSVKEYSGLQHMFVSALGSMAYCEPISMSASATNESANNSMITKPGEISVDWRSIQYLSQDLLEAVVEGPEADEIYEMYFSGDLKASPLEKKTKDAMDVDEDEEGYAAMRDDVVMEG